MRKTERVLRSEEATRKVVDGSSVARGEDGRLGVVRGNSNVTTEVRRFASSSSELLDVDDEVADMTVAPLCRPEEGGGPGGEDRPTSPRAESGRADNLTAEIGSRAGSLTKDSSVESDGGLAFVELEAEESDSEQEEEEEEDVEARRMAASSCFSRSEVVVVVDELVDAVEEVDEAVAVRSRSMLRLLNRTSAS